MIPVGGFDPDRAPPRAASAHHEASTTDVEVLRREAEEVLARLVAQWHDDRSPDDGSYVWDATARETVEALNSVLEAIDEVHHRPRLIRPRRYF